MAVSKADLREPLKGKISTIMITLIIVSVGFFGPLWISHESQKAREGEGRFTPQLESIWSLDDNDDFWKFQNDVDSGAVHSGDQAGSKSALWWSYQAVNTIEVETYLHLMPQSFTMVDFENPNIWGEYMVTTLDPSGTINSNPSNHNGAGATKQEAISIYLDTDIGDLIENDAFRFESYLEIEGESSTEHLLSVKVFTNKGDYPLITDMDFTPGNNFSIQITTSDLIQLASIKGIHEHIRLVLKKKTTIEQFDDTAQIVFDARMHGVVTKTPSVNIIALWFIGYSVMLVVMGLLMLPQISIVSMGAWLRKNFNF